VKLSADESPWFADLKIDWASWLVGVIYDYRPRVGSLHIGPLRLVFGLPSKTRFHVKPTEGLL
jgi:hypothetical protein